jgi:hypothetical protein
MQLRAAPSVGTGGGQAIDRIAQLPPAERAAVVGSYAHALSDTFFAGAAIAACAFILVLFLPERPLRSSHGEPHGESVPSEARGPR